MNEERLEQLLLEALDFFEQGEAVESILLRYPGETEALRPYLATAVQLSQWSGTPEATPSLQAEARSKQAFLSAAAMLEASRRGPRGKAMPWMRRLLAPLLAMLLIAFLAGATLVTAADSALPGDTLYGTKLFWEAFRLSQASNPEALQEQFQQERIREVEQLIETDRRAEVTIVGEIQSHLAGRWVVGGLIVHLTEDTIIEGRPVLGWEAEIVAHTEGGRLIADEIDVRVGGPDDPGEPTPVLPTPTSIPGTATATSQPTPTSTLTPSPLAPTAAPLPLVSDDNDNDSGDVNNNDNDGDNINDNGDENANDNDDDNVNDNGNDNDSDDNSNDNADENVNDNDNEDNSNGNVDEDANDNDDDNVNDNGNDNGDNSGSSGDDNSNDNDNDVTNNNNADENANDNDDGNVNDNSNDNDNDDNRNDNGDNSDSGGDDNSNDNDSDNSNDEGGN